MLILVRWRCAMFSLSGEEFGHLDAAVRVGGEVAVLVFSMVLEVGGVE